jgi:hypothetical protein
MKIRDDKCKIRCVVEERKRKSGEGARVGERTYNWGRQKQPSHGRIVVIVVAREATIPVVVTDPAYYTASGIYLVIVEQ